MTQNLAVPSSVPGLGRLLRRAKAQLETPLAPPMTEDQLAAMQARTEEKRRAAIEALGPKYVLARRS